MITQAIVFGRVKTNRRECVSRFYKGSPHKVQVVEAYGRSTWKSSES